MRALQRRESRGELAHTAQMRHQLVELQEDGQEIVTRELRAFLEVAHHVLERMHALRRAHETDRRSLALDRVELAEEAVELLAKLAVASRGLPQDGVDVLQAG